MSCLCICTSVHRVTPVGAENTQPFAAGFPTSTPTWHSWSVLQDPGVWLTMLRPAPCVTHCRCGHSQPCAASAEELQPQWLRGRVAWPEETLWVFKGSRSFHSSKWCYSWASQFGWIQWSIVVSWAVKFTSIVMNLIWDSQISSS